MLGRMSPGIMEVAAWARGFENFFMDLAADPDFACALMDRVTEVDPVWEIALGLVKDRTVVVSEADDMATQTGSIMSKETYHQLVEPGTRGSSITLRRLHPTSSYSSTPAELSGAYPGPG